MKILALDTSNQTLAIGIMEDHKILGQLQTTLNKNHSTTLMPALEDLTQKISIKPSDFDRIVVAQGPGSYTGLRIGVTTAKTLADTLKIELVGVSSLKTLAANCVGVTGWIVPIFNARRQNVYAGVYQWLDGQLQTIVADQHLSFEQLCEKLQDQSVYFVGVDVADFQAEIQKKLPKAQINTIPAWQYPNGITLAQLGALAQPEKDIHAFLPDYLKLVEAEENWLATHEAGAESYVEKI
ncbi:tRNA (adenosine(37)-N6)-threonylcarbamoyltransferase complex dimerization subunit type 1 TsaB [Enterococcus lemanii]|uniref:tRNA (Adenosine(37)-N6)-threonylcarbamoyltransferase complex dimerization subunit type 1 TsaB n=1 Tax=Enterococcus lemanii TaxID=1159752 RepID=A0ABV9MWU3_9ENTE|nr:tRNA (adenosine(37)-N6)-threonylcarbamoyltransferase complex dimerization subunit type 1 TsaB [Enterococcus lemanii]MBM7708322.1 tRNA threonylcarbamoyl adenosine modification protein YeaZ [Enterococcus lemanii]